MNSSALIGASERWLQSPSMAALGLSAVWTSRRSSPSAVVDEPLYRLYREACRNQYMLGAKSALGKRSTKAINVTSAVFVGSGSSLTMPYAESRRTIELQALRQLAHAG